MWRSLTQAIHVATVAADGRYRLPVDLVPGPLTPRCSALLHGPRPSWRPDDLCERAECGMSGHCPRRVGRITTQVLTCLRDGGNEIFGIPGRAHPPFCSPKEACR